MTFLYLFMFSQASKVQGAHRWHNIKKNYKRKKEKKTKSIYQRH